jgi:hypothetical protein
MGRFIIGFLLFMHGMAHVAGLLASWIANRADFADRPWLLSSQVRLQGPIGRALSPLWLVAMVGLVGSGLGAVLQQGWWFDLAAMGAGVSLAMILLWWRAVPLGAKLGAGLDVILLVLALLPLREAVVAWVT